MVVVVAAEPINIGVGDRESAAATPRSAHRQGDYQQEEAQHHHHHHHHDHSSRTSLTLSSASWDLTAITTVVSEPPGTGIDVPVFLQPLLGVDFLPYAPPAVIPEELDGDPTTISTETEILVPRSVETNSDDKQQQSCQVQDNANAYDNISVHSIHRISSPPPKPEETWELQQLLRQQSERKKKKRGLKAAARAVLHRVSMNKRKPSSTRHKDDEYVLKVDTQLASLPQQQLSFENTSHWISPTATALTELSPVSYFSETTKNGYNSNEAEKHKCLREQGQRQERGIQQTHSEIEQLQSKLAASIAKYQSQLSVLQLTQKQLDEIVQKQAATTKRSGQGITKATPTAQQRRVYKRSESGSFIRVHDLTLSHNKSSKSSSSSSDDHSLSSLSQSGHHATESRPAIATPEFLQIDHYLIEIVQQLIFVGFKLATDEGSRYTPTRETAKLIAQPAKEIHNNDWPIKPWTHAIDQHVYVWTGRVSHEGFGHNWPIVKGRAILHTSAKHVLEYLWDSSLVPKYNPMCQGRDDVYTLQDDVEMTARESPYGFAGSAKVVRSINKHRLLPKGIEMKSLLYARPMEQHKGSYILVSRSVWENGKATIDDNNTAVIRTEMLTGCTILRALADKTCEMTQMTHVHMPGVPEMLAKRNAPNHCVSLMKALQDQFPPP